MGSFHCRCFLWLVCRKNSDSTTVAITMERSTANPVMEKRLGPKAVVPRCIYTHNAGNCQSLGIKKQCSTSQGIQTFLNSLSSREMLRVVPGVGIPYMLQRRSLELESAGTKTISNVPNAVRVLSQQLWERRWNLLWRLLYIELWAWSLWLQPRNWPLFMLSEGVNQEQITHWGFT